MESSIILLIIVGALVFCSFIGIVVYSISIWKKPNNVDYIPEFRNTVRTESMTPIQSSLVEFTGTECTLMFWVYIHKQPMGQFSLVQIGRSSYLSGDTDMAKQISNNMCVYVDSNSKLVVTLPCGQTATNCDAAHQVNVAVPYMPAQRWVHVAITVSLVKHAIMIYIDGENGNPSDTTPKNIADSANVGFPKSTEIVVSSKNPGFPGLISNMAFGRIALTRYDIQHEYNKGPISSRYGLPAYGIRSPIVPE